MAIEVGDSCANLSGQYVGETIISMTGASTAGTITQYSVQIIAAVGDKGIEFALFTESGGNLSYISGTQTGVMTNPSGNTGCCAFTAGVDFTLSTQASVGDYVGCYYQSSQEYATSGGNGSYIFLDENVCELSGQTPDANDADSATTVGGDITAGGGGIKKAGAMYHYMNH